MGQALRGWYLRRPGVAEFTQADQRAWEDEALAPSLHRPALEWCGRFGLLGVPSLYSAEYQKTMRHADDAGPVRSRQDDIATAVADPEFWRIYREPFFVFAFWAVVMHNTLSDLADSEHDRRARGFDNLNLMLENVGLVARENAGAVAPVWASTSLLGHLAAMALFDLSNGVRLGVCQRCGKTFLSRRSDKRTCSERCREAEKKKQRRADPAYRERERERQRTARRNRGDKP